MSRRFHTHEWDMLPDHAFQPRTGKFGNMTLEGGKGGSAPSPDPNIGIAQKQLADLATQQWDMFKTDVYPEMLRQAQAQEKRAQGQYDLTSEITKEQAQYARQDRARYETGAIPAMEKLKADADLYSTQAEQERLAQGAAADISTSMENQRAQESMRQRAYGIDPTSGAAVANNNAIGVTQALISAQAANQTRQAAKDIGLQKQANVYNMYAGLPAQGNASTSLALGSSAQGLAGGQLGISNLATTSGALNSSAQTAMGGWNSMGQIGVGKYNADINKYNAEASNNPFNVMLGAAAGVGTKYALGKIA